MGIRGRVRGGGKGVGLRVSLGKIEMGRIKAEEKGSVKGGEKGEG